MKYLLILFSGMIILIGCGTSKKLQYDFESQSLTDSIIGTLKKYQNNHGSDYSKIKWFALARNTSDGFELIINENTEKENFPFKVLLKKTNRFIKIDNLFIPVIFDIDFLSTDFKKIITGTVNFGGYYFEIKKDNGEYRVSETAILF